MILVVMEETLLSRNTNYSKEQVGSIIDKIKDRVINDNFTVLTTRRRIKNLKFIKAYKLSYDKQKSLLLTLEVDDFSYSEESINFPGTELYFFGMIRNILNCDAIEENIEIYAKFDISDTEDGDSLVAVSLHVADSAIDYLFK